MFRFALVVLAAIGLGSLLFGGAGWAATGAGFLLLAPLMIAFKIMFFLVIFGMVRAAFTGRRSYSNSGPWGWRPRPPSPRRDEVRRPSEQERFDEWHRLQHARDEVDSWVDPEL